MREIHKFLLRSLPDENRVFSDLSDLPYIRYRVIEVIQRLLFRRDVFNDRHMIIFISHHRSHQLDLFRCINRRSYRPQGIGYTFIHAFVFRSKRHLLHFCFWPAKHPACQNFFGKSKAIDTGSRTAFRFGWRFANAHASSESVRHHQINDMRRKKCGRCKKCRDKCSPVYHISYDR